MQTTSLFDENPAVDERGFSPETRILCSDFTWHPAASLGAGDEIIAYDRDTGAGRKHRKLRVASVLSCRRLVKRCYRIRFANGSEVVTSAAQLWLSSHDRGGVRTLDCDTCGGTFRNWQGLASHRRHAHGLPGTWKQNGAGTWIPTSQLRPDTKIKNLGIPWGLDESRDAGYLAAAFDGEGSLSSGAPRAGFHVSFAQLPGTMLSTVERMLKEKGYHTRTPTTIKQSGVCQLPVAGIYDCMRFLGAVRPLRLLEKAPAWLDGRSPFNRHGAGGNAVESVDFVGNREIVAVETSTRTLFAEGLFSHGMT